MLRRLSPRLLFVATAAMAAPIACGSDGVGGEDGEDGSGGGGLLGQGASATGGKPSIDPGCSGDPEVHTGEATYYDFADGSGNCGFPPSPQDMMIAAMNHTDYAASATCGACVAITGPPPMNAQIVVRIVDQCPECPAGDLDLSPEAFEQIAELSEGRVDVTWTYAPCDVSGPIVYHFKEGSNPYWTAVQIRNHTYAIASVEARDASGQFVELPRVDYNFFIAETGLGEGPYDFRVTDVAGHVIEDTGIAFVEAGEVPGAAQFPLCGG